MEAFKQGSLGSLNSVAFRKDSNPGPAPVFFEIIGNTIWHNFECLENGAVFQFSRDPDQHSFLANFFLEGNTAITPSPANMRPPALDPDYITLTRYTAPLTEASTWTFGYKNSWDPTQATPPMNLPRYPPPVNLKADATGERQKYWNFNLFSTTARLDVNVVSIYFSHAFNQRIPSEIPSAVLWATPFYDDNNKVPPGPAGNWGHFCYDIIRVRKIIYSFTEDFNHNGKIDRLRVQTSFNLNGGFGGFDARVQGYEIDTEAAGKPGTGFQRGYQMVPDAIPGSSDYNSFYIYVKEKPVPDSGETPSWDVIRNSTLKDLLTGRILMGDPAEDRNIQSFDTIPPRIAYTLALPDHNQVYVHFTEPVIDDTGFSILPYGAAPAVTAITGGANSPAFSNMTKAPEDEAGPLALNWNFIPPPELSSPSLLGRGRGPAGTWGYLIELTGGTNNGNLTLADLAGGNVTVTLDGVMDRAVRVMNWRDPAVTPDFLNYPAPRYPKRWDYSTGYEDVEGNSHLGSGGPYSITWAGTPGAFAGDSPPASDVFIPPFRLLTTALTSGEEGAGNAVPLVSPLSFTGTALNPDAPVPVEHRVTDILVSRPPAGNADNTTYFVWPIWARYIDPAWSDPRGDIWGDKAAGENTGSGFDSFQTIWDFTGKKFLQNLYDHRLQVLMTDEGALNSLLFGGVGAAPTILPVDNISSEYRMISGNTGLWLPEALAPSLAAPAPVPAEYTYFGPSPYTVSGQPMIAAGGTYLFNHVFPKLPLSRPLMRDFFFHLSGTSNDLFVARLDAAVGVIPPGWFRRVRPFSYEVHDITLQRSGVTILNNVIKPANSESVYVDYRLVRGGQVTIQVFTLDGTMVDILYRGHRDAGEYRAVWRGTNRGGRSVARGMYFIRVVGPDIDEIRKVMVVK
jgi:hypothetical protein